MNHKNTIQALKKLLDQKGFIDIPSHGMSMYPIIRNGSICRFEPYCEEKIKPGDILLYVDSEAKLIGHRFLKKINVNGEIRFLCKGDARYSSDPLFQSTQIIGRMVEIYNQRRNLSIGSIRMKAWTKAILISPSVSKSIQWYLKLRRIVGRTV